VPIRDIRAPHHTASPERIETFVDITSTNTAVTFHFKTMRALRQHGINFRSCITATLATRLKPNRVIEEAGRL
jgi:hypothetical protein